MTQILSEEERNDIEDQCEMIIGKAAFDSIEAAVLAKLDGMELPEKVVIDTHESGIVIRGYTADQLRQAYAQGAADQLRQAPVAYRIPEPDFLGRHHYFDACELKAEPKQLQPLYTRKEAK